MPSLRFAPDRRLVQTLLVLVAIVASLAAPAGGRAQVCGDAVRKAGESCDDGNQQSADGCDEHCRLERRRLDWWQPVFTVPPAGRIRDVLLAPAGILIREWDGIDEERYHLYSREDGKPTHAFPETAAFHGALLDGDIAIAEDGVPQRVNVYDSETLELVQTYVDPPPVTLRQAFGYAIARSDSYVLIQDVDNGVQVFDAATGAHLRTIRGVAVQDVLDFGARMARFGSDAIVSGANAAYVFNPATGTLKRTLAGPGGEGVLGTEFVVLDHRVLLPTRDGRVHVVDATTAEVLHTFTLGVPRFPFSGLAMAQHGDELFIEAPGAVAVFDAATYALRRMLPGPDPGGCFGALPSAISRLGLLVTDLCHGSNFDGIVYLLDPATGRVRAVLPRPEGGAIEEHARTVGVYDTTILMWSQRDESGEAAAVTAFRPCADGVLQPGDECDDGNFEDGDGCDVTCTVTRCGNGVATAGETCDEGTVATDACTPACTLPDPSACEGGVPLERPRMLLRNLGPPSGDEKLAVSGRMAAVRASPATTGLQVLIDAAGAPVFDLTTRTSVVPPGPRGTQPCGARDGWRTDRQRDVYINRSGALEPLCVPGSARGLARSVFERHASAADATFSLRAEHATIAPFTSPPRLTVILGSHVADGLAGRCATHTFGAHDCRLNAAGTTLRCR